MDRDNFRRWFNRQFWKVFTEASFPIKIPQTEDERNALIDSVYTSISSARYSPGIPEAEFVMNKGHGVARTVPVFCIEDYCVYYFCIKELEDVLCGNRTENTFGGWSLGGKLRRSEVSEIECELTDYGRYSFNPLAWTEAFGEFNALLFSQLDGGNYSHVLQFDLSNFYDCVRLDTLERWIREESDSEKGWIITLLFYLLNQWNRRNTGLHPQTVGLPQDALADCSRILANYYLQKYDRFAATVCEKSEAMYFRYSDDQMILMNSTARVDGLLLLLTRNLDRFGLRVNQKKVHVWEADELQTHRCRTIQAVFAQRGDNQNPELVRQFADAYLAMPDADLEKSWNRGMPLLNRLLWAHLRSLPDDLYDRIISRFLSEAYLLCADSKKLKRVYDLNARRSQPDDLIDLLQRLGEKCVHNAFHHDALNFAESINNSELRDHFERRLASLNRQMNENEIS